jgi:hypothetical protein
VEGTEPLVLLAPFIMIAGLLLHFRGRRRAAKALAASPASPLADARPDVLYLRTFRSDISRFDRILLSGLSTEEEDLAQALRPFGDLIAIGQPDESLPLPGAARLYASDAEWKAVVTTHMRSAPLVVIRAGAGPGLLWECSHAFATLPPHRLVILIFNLKVHEYRNFEAQIKEFCHIELPSLERCSYFTSFLDHRHYPTKISPGFIRFSGDWRAQFLPLQFSFVRIGYRDLVKPFRLTLQPVFEAHRVPWQPATRWNAGKADAD